MTPIDEPASAAMPLASHERARAGAYALIAALLLAPPGAALLRMLATAPALAGDGALAAAWRALCKQARRIDAGAAREEHEALFVAVGTPAIDPRASRYGAGDADLVALRQELRALGLARRSTASQPEDHLGALCESMRLLIERRAPLGAQRRLFEQRLRPWYAACLDDIAAGDAARFYAAGARLAAAFFDTETQGFLLVEPEPSMPQPA